MDEKTVIAEFSGFKTFRLGKWVWLSNPCESPVYHFVQSCRDGRALLSNGLTIDLEGNVVDPKNDYCLHEDYTMASCYEVTLKEVTEEELRTLERRQQEAFDAQEDPSDGWSSPDDVPYDSDTERGLSK